jgi:hypothetical protein
VRLVQVEAKGMLADACLLQVCIFAEECMKVASKQQRCQVQFRAGSTRGLTILCTWLRHWSHLEAQRVAPEYRLLVLAFVMASYVRVRSGCTHDCMSEAAANMHPCGLWICM